MSFPFLHIITDDAVLASPDFAARAQALVRSGGASTALHVRGQATPGHRLYSLVVRLSAAARESGGWLLVNDRVDVALATGADGVQLGYRSLPVGAVRALWPDAKIGASVHDAYEARTAVEHGTDFVVLGTIYTTTSHPGIVAGGAALVRSVARAQKVPVVAIGGIMPERVQELVEAGARGIAVRGNIWSAPDPVARMVSLIEAWSEANGKRTHT